MPVHEQQLPPRAQHRRNGAYPGIEVTYLTQHANRRPREVEATVQALGYVAGALTALLDDYERTGDSIMRLLAVEERVPVVQPHLALGRRGHEAWVEHVFADALKGLRGKAHSRRLAQLVVATDVYCWKLLRRDKELDRDQTITAMRELILALHPDPPGGTR